MDHIVLTRGYEPCGKCAINHWDMCSLSSIVLLGVVSDVVACFAMMLDNAKCASGCVFILKYQRIEILVSHAKHSLMLQNVNVSSCMFVIAKYC